MVIVNFIRDKEVGIFARAKRLGKGRALEVPPGIDMKLLRCSGGKSVGGDDSGVSGIDEAGDGDSDSSDDKSN
jgi:hypothetical protein